jgi:lipopolysaccharide transport system ATP-binding protein
MSDIAVQVENLSKQYKIGVAKYRHDTLRDQLADGLKMLFRRNGRLYPSEDTIWALKDVSFEVREGDVVGIIGRNGAGKSTLLKILSRITEPTSGRAKIHGRVSSLLEVGTGFHVELTGRENIYLNGAILGMRRAEITRKFDEIVAFAETEKFIDTPVKHYSSGMHLRLAFAVAAHLEPEILIVDEVLAVGDAAFQKKCLGKMSDVAQEGRTVLFVSHNMAAVRSLCGRAIWLNLGRVRQIGNVDTIVSEYIQASVIECTEQSWPDPQSAPGNEYVRLKHVAVRAGDGSRGGQISLSTPFILEFSYWNLKPDVRINLSVTVFNVEGTCVFATTTVSDSLWHGRAFPAGLFRSVCTIPGHLLNSGMYRVNLLVVKNSATVLYRHEDAIVFEVHDESDMRDGWFGKWPGAVRPTLKWRTELVESQATQAVETRA